MTSTHGRIPCRLRLCITISSLGIMYWETRRFCQEKFLLVSFIPSIEKEARFKKDQNFQVLLYIAWFVKKNKDVAKFGGFCLSHFSH
mmetsp:Transcript_11666/g.16476  ORF Transcript_11666/g.16476 Transcript_11666/m.16476 type:complete len:87 (+) Transcript_11666:237-497(+)